MKTAAIRQAIGSGQFPLAERLWKSYAAQLEQELRCGSVSETALDEARKLVEWARVTLQCMRAHANTRLGCLHIAGVYGIAQPEPQSHLIQTRL